jgi:hypothetical protein
MKNPEELFAEWYKDLASGFPPANTETDERIDRVIQAASRAAFMAGWNQAHLANQEVVTPIKVPSEKKLH